MPHFRYDADNMKTWKELIRESDAGQFAPERAEEMIAEVEKAGDARDRNEGTSVGVPSPPGS